jgi:hypothetical protein
MDAGRGFWQGAAKGRIPMPSEAGNQGRGGIARKIRRTAAKAAPGGEKDLDVLSVTCFPAKEEDLKDTPATAASTQMLWPTEVMENRRKFFRLG